MACEGKPHQGYHEAIAQAVREYMRALMDEDGVGPTDAMWLAQAVADGAAAQCRYSEMVARGLLYDPQSVYGPQQEQEARQ